MQQRAIHTVLVGRGTLSRVRLSRYLCDLSGVLAQPNQLRPAVVAVLSKGFRVKPSTRPNARLPMGEVAFSKSAPSASTKPLLPTPTPPAPAPCRSSLPHTLSDALCPAAPSVSHCRVEKQQRIPRVALLVPFTFVLPAPAPLLPPRLACAVPWTRPAQRSELAAQRLSHQLSSPHPQIPSASACTLHWP